MLTADLRNLRARDQTAQLSRLLASRLREGHAKIESDFRAEFQSVGAGSVSCQLDLRVYAKRPRGFSGHPSRIVQLMLDHPRILNEVNSKYIDRLTVQYHPYVVPANLMTRPITPAELKKVRDIVAKHGVILDRDTKSLSAVKLALKARNNLASSERVYDVKLAFSDETLTVNGKSFAVSPHVAGYSRVRVEVNNKMRVWIRCDALEALAGRSRI